jgi:DNA-binding transcriptional LysR family regulator
MGRSILPEIISKFTDKFPKVSVETLLTDRRVDLLSENIDLAIRAGVLKDSTLIAKKLGSSYFVPVASPKYIKQYGEPTHPRDLKDHLIIHFPPMGTNEWRLFSPKGGLSITVRPRVIINDLYANFDLAMRGDGIALIPAYMCHREIGTKKLIRILPDWRTSVNPVHFVYPGQKFVSPKLSNFITFAQPYIKTLFTESDV